MTPVNSATSTSAAAAASARTGGASSSSTSFDAVVAQLRGSTASGTAAAASGASSGQPDNAAETEDRFLKLLVAQMRNQDPLNPLDNAQVTSQLSQINTVRGLEKLNETTSKLLERTGATGATEAAALVGRRVLVDGSTIQLPEGGAATGGYTLAGAATGVRLEILDAGGAVVDTRTRGETPAGVQTFEWDGRSSTSGRALPPGTYTLRVTATSGNAKVDATPLTSAPVKALIQGADGTSLQLGPIGSRTMADVRAIL